MQDLPEAVAFADPISTMASLHRELTTRSRPLRFALGYAWVVGMLVAVIAGVLLVTLGVVGAIVGEPIPDAESLFFGVLVMLASAYASWHSWKSYLFFENYAILSGAIDRAFRWEPHPSIPEGTDPVDSFIKYLREQDDRVQKTLARDPTRLKCDARIPGSKGADHSFDAAISGHGQRWFKGTPSIQVYLRKADRVGPDDLKALKDEVEDIARGEPSPPLRAILLQTGPSEFSDALIELANTEQIQYTRAYGNREIEWKSPIEVVRIGADGKYRFGSFYFG